MDATKTVRNCMRIGALAGMAALAAACGDPQEGLSPTGGTTAATGSTTTSAGGAGGAGGQGGAGVGGSGGGGGGAVLPCLDAKDYAPFFTVADEALCAVAIYDANVALGYEVPSWGRHGGPLTVGPGAQAGSVALTRFTAPAGATGALATTTTTLDPAIANPKAFLGLQALDLPFFDWTVLTWAGPYPDTQGELLFAKDAAIAARYPVNGPYALTAVSTGGAGRLIYSGTSALSDAMTSVNGLYAADSCGAPGQDPRVEPKGDGTCGPPLLVDAWGDASGPVAADANGDVFAVMASFSGDQEARAYAAKAIERGAPATKGELLFTLPGFGSALAALAPDGSGEGLVAFQPADGVSFAPLDVVAQRFEVKAGHVAPKGTPTKLLALTTAGTGLSLVTDGQERIWVGVPNGKDKTSFVVLARVAK